jgi:hypothetical protein
LSSSSGYSNYQWFKNGVLISGANNLSYFATTTGTYTVLVTDGGGCVADTSSATIVTVNAVPTIPTISAGGATAFCSGGSVVLTSSSTTNNQWYLNGSPISGATNQTYTASNTGSYTIFVSNGVGCAASSTGIAVINNGPTKGFNVNAFVQEVCTNNFQFTAAQSIFGNTYKWDFGDGNIDSVVNPSHTFSTLGTFNVKQVVTNALSGCKDSVTQTVTVVICGVSSGGGGGLETKSLGDIIAERLYGKAFKSESTTINYNTAKQFTKNTGTIVNGVGGLTLSDMIPLKVPNTTNSYISTPSDLTIFTNAIEVMSVDYTANNYCKAVALGTRTLGDVYTHTKSICDRLKDAELVEVKKLYVNGYSMIAYKIKQRGGELEYCVNFSVGVKVGRNNFSLQSNWLTNNYMQEDTLYNFQLWSVSYDMSTIMATEILNKLKTVAYIQSLPTSTLDIPAAYMKRVQRNKNNLEITVYNPTANTTGYFTLDEKTNEFANNLQRTIPFTIDANTTKTITVNVGDNYEDNIYMHLDNNPIDLVYMSDGAWNKDYNKLTTTLNTFNIINVAVETKADEYPLYRKVQIAATTKDYVSAYKLVGGAGIEKDLTAFKTIKFKASAIGTNTLKITLVKKGITDWKDQYYYNVVVGANEQDFEISLSKFVSKLYSTNIAANDITAIAFTWENTRGITNNIGGTVSKAKLIKEDVAIAQALANKDITIFPNPNDGKFTVNFKSEIVEPLMMKVVDVFTGRVLYQEMFTSIKGENIRAIAMKNVFSSNIYLLTIEGDNVKYNTEKLFINKK